MNNEIPRERGKGILGTALFHVAVLLILIFAGFSSSPPDPMEEGILVNFGTDEGGSGFVEPVASSQPQTTPPPESTPPLPVEETTEDAVETQDFEEAPVAQKQEEKKVDPEKEKRREEELEAERIRKEQEEQERLRREAEEAERKKREEDQKRINEIMNRTRSALENSKNTGENTATSEGETGESGNQGNESGSVDSRNRGDGSGTGNEGISYSLAGRTPMKLPKPEYNYQDEGKVVVEVTVDRNGNVTAATAGVKGSNTLDEYLLRVARTAALQAKFDRKPDAPVIQKGTITYHFMLR